MNSSKLVEISLTRAAAQALILAAALPLVMGALRSCGGDTVPTPPPSPDAGMEDAEAIDGGAEDGGRPEGGQRDAHGATGDSGVMVENKVYFITPLEGEELRGPSVRVQLGVSGVELRTWTGVAVPGAGNFVLYVDRDCVVPGSRVPVFVEGIVHLRDAQDETIVNFQLGTHRLCLGMEDGAGFALDLRAVVGFSVVE